MYLWSDRRMSSVARETPKNWLRGTESNSRTLGYESKAGTTPDDPAKKRATRTCTGGSQVIRQWREWSSPWLVPFCRITLLAFRCGCGGRSFGAKVNPLSHDFRGVPGCARLTILVLIGLKVAFHRQV